jgi:hypothetical protein
VSSGLPDAAKAELHARNTGGVWLVLVTVEHADFAAPLRYVNDRQNVTSGGDVYTALAFTVQLPADRDAPPRATLTLDNVTRAAVAAMRAITTPPSLTLEVIRRVAPNTILLSYPNLKVLGSQISARSIVLEIGADPVFDESYPGTDFTPLVFPAGFDR